jgi:signal transduction histidine kinase
VTSGQRGSNRPAPLLPGPQGAELLALAAAFNDILARPEQNVKRQRQFLADASHELRGPLMVIRGNLDLLQMDLPPEERKAAAREAAEEAERMARLIASLLFLAEEDAHDRLETEQVAIEGVVAEVWQRALSVDAGAYTLTLECNEPALVLGDRYRLTQMLWNLVENALRYTNSGGAVALCSRVSGKAVELTVADTGVGIPSEHIPRLFERFYRVDRERSRTDSSTGLGLPIVKQVAEAHGGRVRLESRLGEAVRLSSSCPSPQLVNPDRSRLSINSINSSGTRTACPASTPSVFIRPIR